MAIVVDFRYVYLDERLFLTAVDIIMHNDVIVLGLHGFYLGLVGPVVAPCATYLQVGAPVGNHDTRLHLVATPGRDPRCSLARVRLTAVDGLRHAREVLLVLMMVLMLAGAETRSGPAADLGRIRVYH